MWNDTAEGLINAAPPYEKIEREMVLTTATPRRSVFQTVKLTLLKAQKICSTCAITTCVVLLVLSILAVVFRPLGNVVHAMVIDNGEPPSHVTNTKFLSVALDSSLIADGFKHFNMSDPKLWKLIQPLAPGYLRIGGNMADRLWFVSDKTITFKSRYFTDVDGGECTNKHKYCDQHYRPNFTMSESEWLQLNWLAGRTGLTLLFDLNCLIRNGDGSWNATNAEKLIKFSDQHELTVMWELGNEPNAFQHVFNYKVNASQLASDYFKLRFILNRYPRYRNALLVGPSTTRPLSYHKASQYYLHSFLLHGKHAVNAITWHQYYFNGKTATAIDFLNPHIFDVLEQQIHIVKKIVRGVGIHKKPIWLGETSSAYGGGSAEFSNKYISTFIWLDKLGLAARSGLDLVIRQSLFKGYYALIDDDLEPRPDWWLSVIYKMLVGPEVIPCYSKSSRFVRLYCQCTAKTGLYGIFPAVTIFGSNMKSVDAKLRIEGVLPTLTKETTKIFAYVLTPHVTLLSKHMRLNDDVLRLLPNGDLPPIKPKIIDTKPYLTIPPYSLVFWILPSTSLKYCRPHQLGDINTNMV